MSMVDNYKHKIISIYADIMLSILIYVYVVEISLNLLTLPMNSELALFLGWIIVPIMLIVAYLASGCLLIIVLFLVYINWTREIKPKDKVSINNKFLFSFLYLVLIVLLYLFLGSNKKPCADCIEFQSYVNELILESYSNEIYLYRDL